MTSPCRLCGGPTTTAFTLEVLSHLDVEYFICERCGSLETESPYWLDEAYGPGAIADLDTGLVMRNLEKQALVVTMLRVLGLPRGSRILDFGGGTGLLCRLLRDVGVDAWVYDPRGGHELSRGFVVDRAEGPFDLVCAFEVVEHLAEPAETLRELAPAADALLVGTEPYLGQGNDWWYLTPKTGQHVFFFSPQGFQWLARVTSTCISSISAPTSCSPAHHCRQPASGHFGCSCDGPSNSWFGRGSPTAVRMTLPNATRASQPDPNDRLACNEMAVSAPVALLVFNRPDLTRRVLAAVRRAAPSKVLIVADGPPRRDRASALRRSSGRGGRRH